MRIQHGGNVFAVARARGWRWRDILDFSASINPLGPAPGVRDAIARTLDRIVHYPDPYASFLTERLAESWGLHPDEILVGNGATELLHFLARVWPQRDVTLVVPTFSEFHRAYPHAVPVPWRHPDRWPTEGLLIVTRPNNPSGEMFPLDWLAQLRLPGPDQTILFDESFLDFTDQPSAMTLIHQRPSILVLRSLTKFFALPGLRVGALVGPRKFLQWLKQRREPWQVNVLAEAAALASLADRAHAERTRAYVAAERDWILPRLKALPGVQAVPTTANYFLMFLGARGGLEWGGELDGSAALDETAALGGHSPGAMSEAHSAAALCDWMLEQKILLRNQTGTVGIAGEAVRFSIRAHADNERFLDLLGSYLCARFG